MPTVSRTSELTLNCIKTWADLHSACALAYRTHSTGHRYTRMPSYIDVQSISSSPLFPLFVSLFVLIHRSMATKNLSPRGSQFLGSRQMSTRARE